jgi:hypothetical protein
LANDGKISGYVDSAVRGGRAKRVLGLGAVAAISAFAGGMAVAFWHRKTLVKLQNPIPQGETEIQEFTDEEIERENIDGF